MLASTTQRLDCKVSCSRIKILPQFGMKLNPIRKVLVKSLKTNKPYLEKDVQLFVKSLATSYKSYLNKDLIGGVEAGEDLCEFLYNAPFVCVAHKRFLPGLKEPIFNYGNKAAFNLWECSWEQFVGMPSRLSAVEEPNVQTERNAFIDRVAQTGYSDSYEGWRISTKGKKFKIQKVMLFNIKNDAGNLIGQSAVFDSFKLEDGSEWKIQANGKEPLRING